MANLSIKGLPDRVHKELKKAAEAGVTAVIQPGGSIRDNESLAVADAAGMVMVLTGVRHFRH